MEVHLQVFIQHVWLQQSSPLQTQLTHNVFFKWRFPCKSSYNTFDFNNLLIASAQLWKGGKSPSLLLFTFSQPSEGGFSSLLLYCALFLYFCGCSMERTRGRSIFQATKGFRYDFGGLLLAQVADSADSAGISYYICNEKVDTLWRYTIPSHLGRKRKQKENKHRGVIEISSLSDVRELFKSLKYLYFFIYYILCLFYKK